MDPRDEFAMAKQQQQHQQQQQQQQQQHYNLGHCTNLDGILLATMETTTTTETRATSGTKNDRILLHPVSFNGGLAWTEFTLDVSNKGQDDDDPNRRRRRRE
jgi:hypothetical protein